MDEKKVKSDRLMTWIITGVSVSGVLYFGYRAVFDRAGKEPGGPLAPGAVQSLGKIDPALVKYAETRTIPIPVKEVYGIASDGEGNLYVTGDSRVLVLDRDGKMQPGFATQGTALSIAAGREGSLYLGMTDHIEVWDRSGVLKARWSDSGPSALLTSIAVAGEYVYAADAGSRILRKYDLQGKRLREIGGKDPARGIHGCVVPGRFFDVGIDPDGSVWLANPGRHTLENYTPEGEPKASWGVYSLEINGFCACCNPGHIAVLGDGRIVTAEKGIPRIKVYDRNGNLEAVVAGPDQFAEGTEGLDLAVDAKGRIMVLDPQKKAVRIFEKKDPGVS